MFDNNKSGLDGLIDLANNLNLDNIKEDLYKMYNLSEEQIKEVEVELSKKGYSETKSELETLKGEIKKTFR